MKGMVIARTRCASRPNAKRHGVIDAANWIFTMLQSIQWGATRSDMLIAWWICAKKYSYVIIKKGIWLLHRGFLCYWAMP